MLPSPMEICAVTTGAVLVVVALAAREDLLRQRIPNTLNASALVLGITLASIAGGWAGFTDSIGGAVVGCAALVPFWLLRGMGAGDVKLMAAAGAFIGPSGTFTAVLLALIAGGVLALGLVVVRLVEPRPVWEAPPDGGAQAAKRVAAKISVVRKERFPYAVAIGCGVVAALWLQGSLAGLYSALGIG